jgi:hypothetical protein
MKKKPSYQKQIKDLREELEIKRRLWESSEAQVRRYREQIFKLMGALAEQRGLAKRNRICDLCYDATEEIREEHAVLYARTREAAVARQEEKP